ncbi:MAG: homoserine O-acetyltransferase [Spirochaetia bacterium]|jgi:homoserine O-acetyltransferase|nr:homoserine O-acetyltransferase [Spirochaetia bacterium]
MSKENNSNSVGIVETQFFTFDKLELESGREIAPVTIAYETYGTLNEDKSNAIFILHALSGSAHAAGYNSPDEKSPGWWDIYIGPGRAFDTEKYFIISSNTIGGCNGSTGPATINPSTGVQYGLDFPIVTICDMVKAQRRLMEHFGITKLLAAAGGSMGGMQSLAWSILYPEMVHSVLAIATAARLSAQGIAFHEVGRQAIINDPNWSRGKYYGHQIPGAGLSLARMIAHITYLSEQNMHERFGRKFQENDPDAFSFKTEYMVESYLHHQGDKFVDRFDANSYLYITRAIDLFDLSSGYGSLIPAFEKVKANYLVISFTSDWLYTSSMSRDIVQALRGNGKNVVYTNIETDKGHDSFLIDNALLQKNISNFLRRQYDEISWKNDGA